MLAANIHIRRRRYGSDVRAAWHFLVDVNRSSSSHKLLVGRGFTEPKTRGETGCAAAKVEEAVRSALPAFGVDFQVFGQGPGRYKINGEVAESTTS